MLSRNISGFSQLALDLVDPALVPSAFEFRGQPDVHDFQCQSGSDNPSAEGQHIGVVVGAAHLCGEGVGDHRAANAFDFIGSQGDADAGAASEDALVGFAGGDHFGGGPSEFRVVHGFGGVGADVFQVVAFFE